MPEDYNEPAQAPLDLKKYQNLLVRRRWYVVIPLFLVWALIWAASWVMPSVYRSSTLILVLQPAVTIVGSSPGNQLQDHLDGIETQMRSHTLLIDLARRFNPYPSKHMSDDAIVAKMNKGLLLEPVRSPGKTDVSSFNISFEADTPEAAQAVTRELGQMLTSESLEMQAQVDANNVKFLDSQLEDARTKMAAQDERVRIFKDRHMGELPTQMQSNLQILQGLQGQLQSEQDQLGQAEQHKVLLESLQTQYKSMGTGTVKASADPTPSGLAALDAELAKEKDALTDLLSKYTEQHPDVKKKKEQIAETEKRRAQRAAELQAAQAGAHDSPTAVDMSNPTAAAAMEVSSQLKANAIDIANRQRAIDSLQLQISQYQSRLNSAPAREQDLTDLTRDQTQSQKTYEDLLARKSAAELGKNLSQSQEGLQFRTQDPANLPTKPSAPKRFLFSIAGLFAGFVVGVAVAMVAEFLDGRIYDEAEFEKLVPVEIMAEIPPLVTAEEDAIRHRRFRVELAAAGVMSMIIFMGVALSFLRG